jgi:hypothetical protein
MSEFSEIQDEYDNEPRCERAMRLAGIRYVDRPHCCESCHDDHDLGYADLFLEVNGTPVCCAALNAIDAIMEDAQ